MSLGQGCLEALGLATTRYVTWKEPTGNPAHVMASNQLGRPRCVSQLRVYKKDGLGRFLSKK